MSQLSLQLNGSNPASTKIKDRCELVQVTKEECKELLRKYHYLSNISKGFKTKFNVGLRLDGELVGVCIFTGFPVPQLCEGMLGLKRTEQAGLWELSRLCLSPSVQGAEKNLTSWFVARAMKMLRKEEYVRVILSYADSNYHSGTIYRACNFKYYGLTDRKTDFFKREEDGSWNQVQRGPVKHLDGEWRPRSRKHRFLLIYDKKLNCKWEEQSYPKPKGE